MSSTVLTTIVTTIQSMDVSTPGKCSKS